MQIAAATAPTTTPTTSPTSPVAAASHSDQRAERVSSELARSAERASLARSEASDRNPWGFPRLDSAVAQQAHDGLRAAERTVNHLIDRSIAVRVQLDQAIRTGSFTLDAVRAVELLTRARDYAMDTLDERDLPNALQVKLHDWIRANPKDDRIGVVFDDIYDIEHTVQDLLDDDEGNVREEIAAMRSNPSRRTFQSVRDSLDGSIAALYDARDVSSSLHVLRAAGELR